MPDSKDTLLHQLVEVEVNGAEAGKQVAALRDVMSRLKYVRAALHAFLTAPSIISLLEKDRAFFCLRENLYCSAVGGCAIFLTKHCCL